MPWSRRKKKPSVLRRGGTELSCPLSVSEEVWLHLPLSELQESLGRRAGSAAAFLSGPQARVPTHRETIRKAHAGCEQWLAPDLGGFAYCPVYLAVSGILPPSLWLTKCFLTHSVCVLFFPQTCNDNSHPFPRPTIQTNSVLLPLVS